MTQYDILTNGTWVCGIYVDSLEAAIKLAGGTYESHVKWVIQDGKWQEVA